MLSDLPGTIQGLVWVIISFGGFYLFYLICLLIVYLYKRYFRNNENYSII